MTHAEKTTALQSARDIAAMHREMLEAAEARLARLQARLDYARGQLAKFDAVVASGKTPVGPPRQSYVDLVDKREVELAKQQQEVDDWRAQVVQDQREINALLAEIARQRIVGEIAKRVATVFRPPKIHFAPPLMKR